VPTRRQTCGTRVGRADDFWVAFFLLPIAPVIGRACRCSSRTADPLGLLAWSGHTPVAPACGNAAAAASSVQARLRHSGLMPQQAN